MAERFPAFRRNSAITEIPTSSRRKERDEKEDAARRESGRESVPMRRTRRAIKETEDLAGNYLAPELGNNKPAFEYVRAKYEQVLAPLVEGLRADSKVQSIFKRITEDRKLFRTRTRSLARQRKLSKTEREYFDSVQLLTVFNPHIVAAAKADIGVATEYARHHLQTLSEKTLSDLRDGEYIPLVQIGLGPQGVIALAEVVRNNPNLARTMLIVDAADEPGGPFGVPRGPAWSLNSANAQSRGRVLPTLGGDRGSLVEEGESVRAYGSPLRYFPGERRDEADVREGSINMLADYLPHVDDISPSRYATNEELQVVSLLQSSMLASRLALRTKVVSVEPKNKRSTLPGDKIVTVEIQQEGKRSRRIFLRTDAVFVATGLGAPSYGFDIDGRRAATVLENSKNGQGPRLYLALAAFRALVSRTEKPASFGEKLVIYGNGDSTRTLVENLASLFRSDNPYVRSIKKIYIVASDTDNALRPRYQALTDVFARNGNGALVEFIEGRISDVGYNSTRRSLEERKLLVYDEADNPVTSRDGDRIEADTCIAAVGFSPQLASILETYDRGGRFQRQPNFLSVGNATSTPVRLPRNDAVSVGETLREDPNILILGTASVPDFDADKFQQLPEAAADALSRVGSENAVAIGFRGPDTQAAVNVWLNSRTLSFEPKAVPAPRPVQLEGTEPIGAGIRIPITVNLSDLGIPNNVSDEERLLTPLVTSGLGELRLIQANGLPFNKTIEFTVRRLGDSFDVSFSGTSDLVANDQPMISVDCLKTVASLWRDAYIQRYSLSRLNRKRGPGTLRVTLSFRRGKVIARESFVEA